MKIICNTAVVSKSVTLFKHEEKIFSFIQLTLELLQSTVTCLVQIFKDDPVKMTIQPHLSQE